MFDDTINPGPKSTKMKIDFTDQDGAKYSLTVQDPTKENIVKLMDFIQTIKPTTSTEVDQRGLDTNYNKLYSLLEQKFPFGSFTSTDVIGAYEEELGINASLSTIATYLGRMAERGLLSRSKNGAGWIYKLPRRQHTVEQNNSAAEFIPR